MNMIIKIWISDLSKTEHCVCILPCLDVFQVRYQVNEGFSVDDKASDALCVVGNDIGCSLLFALQSLFPEKVSFVQIPDELLLFAVRITLGDLDLKSTFQNI